MWCLLCNRYSCHSVTSRPDQFSSVDWLFQMRNGWVNVLFVLISFNAHRLIWTSACSGIFSVWWVLNIIFCLLAIEKWSRYSAWWVRYNGFYSVWIAECLTPLNVQSNEKTKPERVCQSIVYMQESGEENGIRVARSARTSNT